ncbi:unnamed protein product [Adineta steineri]|uniref:Uncharacterized protein n=1 Tax=Adineta steineri TaxID=433720 RepID=A0A815S166_9BILA|nr:unnamed protein product [Adineta steineri]CAF1639812.1 unnamed protein product [Adineta steineri]
MSDDKEHMDTNNKNKKGGTKRNFIMICFAYTCVTTSLNAVVNLQSSLNTDKDVGLNSVAIMHGASVLTCIFLTTSIGHIFGYKWSIIGGQFGILLYVASNMYPKQWLMYSTAIISGSFRACMSMAQNSYVAILANDESENDDAEIKTRKYFGIFFTAYQSAQIRGNLISYLVLRNTPKTTNTNFTQCGANYLTSEHQIQDDNHQLISQKTSFTTCTIGVQYVGLIMTIYGITATISSIVVTYTVKFKYSRRICFIIAALLSYTIFTVMLVWKPTVSQTYVLFILPFLSSISDGLTEPFVTGLT